MMFQTSSGTALCTALSVGCAAITGVSQIAQNLQSGRSEDGRVKALTTITQHVVSDACWNINGQGSFKIGDEIELEGSGKSPTSCFINRRGQYAFGAYLNGTFQIIHVFTLKEVNAKKSQLLSKEQK